MIYDRNIGLGVVPEHRVLFIAMTGLKSSHDNWLRLAVAGSEVAWCTMGLEK